MPIRNSDQAWGAVSLGIHWLTVAMVLGLIAVGLLMQELSFSSTKATLYSLHKTFGLTVLGLTVMRLLWRLYAGAPAPVPGTPRWQSAIASVTHGVLYLILLAMPISGWLYHSASGYPPRNLSWFGLFKLPSLSDRDEPLRDAALAAHEWLFIALAVIVTVHALAALKHHYIDRDRTLARMLPLAKPAPKPHDDSGA
ncbi:cytochrome b [Arenimonas alkanexedens]